ncbi:hypothetical protein GACE_0995 [Geoglobus acetivorans]|uniref:Uncharacterized protein n=1 Tax=Geoglobus acetivorans TaxID=565033 RepID=A0A0A7GD93_GEOAI|nr:hypothetical protein GACE_0995 [Geoglobus acetivorans]
MYLVYFEEILNEYWETVDYSEYCREEPRFTWERYLKIECFEREGEALNRAAELIHLVDGDYNIQFIGVFRGNKMVYGSEYVHRVANELYHEVTA